MEIIKYKTSSKSIVAQSYNISVRTLNKWLAPIKDDVFIASSKLFTPKQVGKIVEFLGEPEHIELIRA